MYVFIGIFFAICLLFYIIGFWRRRRIRKKVCRMNFVEKCCRLNELIEPFGFVYLPRDDIFSSVLDGWQREFGYCAAFDTAAPHLNMVFDCEPVYFDYDSRTWLLEFWKGQYGINAGAEIGIYQADAVLSPGQYKTALFHSVPDEEMLPFQMELLFQNRRLFLVERVHWWLTGFRMGQYCEPEDLQMQISVTFPNQEMLRAFLEGMRRAGYTESQLSVRRLTVSFTFDHAMPSPENAGKTRRCGFASRFSQWKNRMFCRLFRRVTRPFTCTVDRMLYLYFFLPVAFRRMLEPRKYRMKKHGRRYHAPCRRGRKQKKCREICPVRCPEYCGNKCHNKYEKNCSGSEAQSKRHNCSECHNTCESPCAEGCGNARQESGAARPREVCRDECKENCRNDCRTNCRTDCDESCRNDCRTNCGTDCGEGCRNDCSSCRRPS